MGKAKQLLLGVGGLIILYVAFNYFFGSAEAKIKDIIEEAKNAVNIEDNGALFTDVALEYQDESGMKYLPAKYIMGQFFKRTDNVNLRVENVSVTVNGKEATASVSLILVGSRGGKSYHILGKPGNPTMIDIGFKKGLTGWKVHSTKNIRPARPSQNESEE